MVMKPIEVPQELFDLFLGGLLTVCRCDDVVNREEMAELERIGRELRPGMDFDPEMLLTMDVSPADLAAAINATHAAPYRVAAFSPPEEVREAFVEAAKRVALIDGEMNENEEIVLRRFSRALRER